MKLAVIKLGARLVFGDKVGTSGGSGEAASLVNMLVEGGTEVHCYTKVLPKDSKPNNITMFNIEDEYAEINNRGYDGLIVVNGSVNFFGGAEDRAQILNYWLINNFKGSVIYLYCDPNLQLKQLWGAMEKKPWSSKYNEKDIVITRDIHVISQSYNLEKIKEIFEKQDYKLASIDQYDFQKFPMMASYTLHDPTMFGYASDISYGGTFRSGRREKKLIDFYFGYPDDIDIEVFGKIKLTDFNEKKIENLRPPKFTGTVDYNKMIHKMSESRAHVVIGDNQYPGFEMISQRAYEAVMAGCVVFVDSEFDKNRRIFGANKALSDFLYVDNRDQVIDKIRNLEHKDIQKISEMQKKAIGFNKDEYCQGFIKLIESKL